MDDAASRTQGAELQIGPDERLITLKEATGLLPRMDGKSPGDAAQRSPSAAAPQ